MRSAGSRGHAILSALAAAGLAASIAFGLASCATIPKATLGSDPAAYLTFEPQAYFRLSGIAARDIVASLGPAGIDTLASSVATAADGPGNGGSFDMRSLTALLGKTRSMGVGIAGIGLERIRLEAVLIGEYPGGTIKYAMATADGWTREGSTYTYRDGGLYLQAVSPGVVVLSTEKPGPDRAAVPATRGIPRRFDGPGVSDLAVWIEQPLSLLPGNPMGAGAESPIKGFLLRASRAMPGGSPAESGATGPKGAASGLSYAAEAVFLMKDADSARIYRPVVRLAWASIADLLFGSLPGSPASAPTQEGDLFVVRDLDLPISAIADLVMMLGSAGP